jgi:hypothetical protein
LGAFLWSGEARIAILLCVFSISLESVVSNSQFSAAMSTVVGKFTLPDITLAQFVILFWEGDYIPNFDHRKKGEVNCVLSPWRRSDDDDKVNSRAGFTRDKKANFPIPMKLPWLPDFAELIASHHIRDNVEVLESDVNEDSEQDADPHAGRRSSISIVERTKIVGIPWVDPTIVLTWTVIEVCSPLSTECSIDVTVELSFEYGYYSLIQSMVEMNTISEMHGHYQIWHEEALAYLNSRKGQSDDVSDDGNKPDPRFLTILEHIRGLTPQLPTSTDVIKAEPAVKEINESDEDPGVLSPIAVSETLTPAHPVATRAQNVRLLSKPHESVAPEDVSDQSITATAASFSADAVKVNENQAQRPPRRNSDPVNASLPTDKASPSAGTVRIENKATSSIIEMTLIPDVLELHVGRKRSHERVEYEFRVACMESYTDDSKKHAQVLMCFIALTVGVTLFVNLFHHLGLLSGIFVDTFIALLWLYTIHLLVKFWGNYLHLLTVEEPAAAKKIRTDEAGEAKVANDTEMHGQQQQTELTEQTEGPEPACSSTGLILFQLKEPLDDATVPSNSTTTSYCNTPAGDDASLASDVEEDTEMSTGQQSVTLSTIGEGDEDSDVDKKLIELLGSFHDLCVEDQTAPLKLELGTPDITPETAPATTASSTGSTSSKFSTTSDIVSPRNDDDAASIPSINNQRSVDKLDKRSNNSPDPSIVDEFDLPMIEDTENFDVDGDDGAHTKKIAASFYKRHKKKPSGSSKSALLKSQSSYGSNGQSASNIGIVVDSLIINTEALFTNPAALFSRDEFDSPEGSANTPNGTARRGHDDPDGDQKRGALSAAGASLGSLGSFILHPTQIFSPSSESDLGATSPSRANQEARKLSKMSSKSQTNVINNSKSTTAMLTVSNLNSLQGKSAGKQSTPSVMSATSSVSTTSHSVAQSVKDGAYTVLSGAGSLITSPIGLFVPAGDSNDAKAKSKR